MTSTIIKSTNTEAINHEPAIMLMNTGNMNAGKPCLGSWLAYGLGSMNDNLPTFMVLQSKLNTKENNQPVSSRLVEQRLSFLGVCGRGIAFAAAIRCSISAIPDGVDREVRRKMLDAVEGDQPADVCRSWAIRKPMRALLSTKWLIACRLRFRSLPI